MASTIDVYKHKKLVDCGEINLGYAKAMYFLLEVKPLSFFNCL